MNVCFIERYGGKSIIQLGNSIASEVSACNTIVKLFTHTKGKKVIISIIVVLFFSFGTLLFI